MTSSFVGGIPRSARKTPYGTWVISVSASGGLPVAARLNGKKSLVLGNNDRYESKDYRKYFNQITGIIEMKDFALSHVPLHESQLKRWRFNVHGHLHLRTVKRLRHRDDLKHVKLVDDFRYLCVNCEQINLIPVLYD